MYSNVFVNILQVNIVILNSFNTVTLYFFQRLVRQSETAPERRVRVQINEEPQGSYQHCHARYCLHRFTSTNSLGETDFCHHVICPVGSVFCSVVQAVVQNLHL